jgi:hypothetical protein
MVPLSYAVEIAGFCDVTLALCLRLALAEARDIKMHLLPLRYQLENMEQVPFEECEPLWRPLMNTVCLVWANSQYFNTPARLVLFMQEVCNLIIEMVSAAGFARLPINLFIEFNLSHDNKRIAKLWKIQFECIY